MGRTSSCWGAILFDPSLRYVRRCFDQAAFAILKYYMGKQHIGILGSGNVGITLANGFRSLGYEVIIGRREEKPIDDWTGSIGTFEHVAENSEILVLCVKGLAAEDVVTKIIPWLSHKLIIDTTNPIANAPPNDGVLQYFTNLDDSLMERLQKIAPSAHFVKAFNSCGSSLMVKPTFPDGPPTMFICGNNTAAKKTTTDLLNQFGWHAEDMGSSVAARAIEPLCMLWCIPGLQRNQWSHAFKLLKS